MATQVPLLPAPSSTSGLIPLDTWLGGLLPGLRDLYRVHLARLFELWRLPTLVMFLAIATAVMASWRRLGA